MKINKNKTYQGSRERQSVYDTFYKENGVKKPVLIFSHGFKGFKDHGCFNQMAEFWAENDFAFIKFNFSYNGGTIENPIDFPELEAFAENNYTTELDDLEIIISETIAGNLIPLDEINTNEIYLMGHSRGGGITILKGLEDNRVKKFISLGAITDMNRFHYPAEALAHWKSTGVHHFENLRTHQMMPLNYQFYQNYSDNEERLSIEKQILKLNKPYLNIHGSADETVKVDEAKAIKEWNNQVELSIINEANHAFGSAHPWNEETMPVHFKQAMEEALLFFSTAKS